MSVFRPKILNIVKNYSKEKFVADLIAGVAFSAIFIKDFICIWIEIYCLSPKYNWCFKNRLNSNLDAANYAKFNILVIV